MGQQKTHETLARQWQILMVMPDREPGLTVRELQQRLEDEGYFVEKRTVQRDLDQLEGILPVEKEEKNGRGHYWLRRGWHLNLAQMSVAQALSHRLIEDFIKPLLPKSVIDAIEPSFETARIKLEKLANSNKVSSLANKVRAVAPALTFMPPAIDQSLLDELQNALINNQVCEAEYQKLGATRAGAIVIKPLSLVQRGPVTYVIALSGQSAQPKQYNVQRFQSVKRTDITFEPPRHYSLDDYIAKGNLGFGLQGDIHLVCRIHPDIKGERILPTILRETPISSDMQLVDHGEWHQLEATVADTWQLRWWLMSHADEVEVVEPKSLRADIAARLKQAKSRYGR
jgi:predicted DNA-binding transcriptional regulator YafY